MCRSRRELSNEYLLAKIGVDTAENEPLEVWGKLFNIIHSCPQLRSTACSEYIALLRSLLVVLLTVSRLAGEVHIRVIRRLVCQGEVTNHPHDAVKTLLAAFKSDVPQRRCTRRVVANSWQHFGRMSLVFGCIGTDLCKQIHVFQHVVKSTR